MESLKIKATQITPEICFDIEKKVFIISGESRPENVKDFLNQYCYGSKIILKN